MHFACLVYTAGSLQEICLWPLRCFGLSGHQPGSPPQLSFTIQAASHCYADPAEIYNSTAARSSKPISSGSPFKCCANSNYTLKRVFYTNSCIAYSVTELGRTSGTDQVSNMCSDSYTSVIVEAGGRNETLNIPFNQFDYKFSVSASLYF